MATHRNPSEKPRRAARHDDYTCNGPGHRTYRHERNLCDVLIARLGHWCFRGDRCNRSSSKDQQGWILQLSLPESKLDWKLPEDIFPWAFGIVRAFNPNGIQSRKLCICSSAKAFCMLSPSVRVGLVDKRPTLCPEPSAVLADVVAVTVKRRRACKLQHDHG